MIIVIYDDYYSIYFNILGGIIIWDFRLYKGMYMIMNEVNC